jgi:hypothetical protein
MSHTTSLEVDRAQAAEQRTILLHEDIKERRVNWHTSFFVLNSQTGLNGCVRYPFMLKIRGRGHHWMRMITVLAKNSGPRASLDAYDYRSR